MNELFVYYQLRPERAVEARAAFEATRAGAPVRLLQRGGSGSLMGFLTWMEVYPAGSDALEARIAAAMVPFVEGLRHREAFMPLDP